MARHNWMRRLVVMIEITLLLLSISSIAPLSTANATDCTVDVFTVAPNASPQPVGTVLALHGEGKCNGGIRASRFNIDGQGFGEDAGASSQDETWAITAGDHTICFEIAGGSNAEWSNGASSCMNIRGEAPTAVCSVSSFSVSPGSGTVGTTFTLSGSGNCNIGVRAVRFMIDGVPFGEFAGPSHTTPWGSAGYSVGDHVIEFQVTAGEWSAAAVASTIVTLTDPNAPPSSTPPPSTTPPPTVTPTPTPPGTGLPFWCSSTPPSGRWIRIVATSGMLVRALPTTLARTIGRANTGTYCQVVGSLFGWYLVSSNGRLGWIYGGNSYIQPGTGSTSTPTPSPTPAMCSTSDLRAYDMGGGVPWDRNFVIDVYNAPRDDGFFLYYQPFTRAWVSIRWSPHYRINNDQGVRFGVSTLWAYNHPWWSITAWRYVYSC